MTTFLFIVIYAIITVLVSAAGAEYVERVDPRWFDRFTGEIIAGLIGVLWPLTIPLYFVYRIGGLGRQLRLWVRRLLL